MIIHRLHQILRPFLLRRMKVDVASQLPQKVEVIVKCALTPWQRVVYDQIRSQEGMATVGVSGEVKVKRMQNTFMQLRKIVNHPFLFECDNPAFQTNYVASPELIRCSGKFALLHRMLPKLIRTGHKILLFCQMTKVLDLLEDYLHWKSIKFVRLDGASKSELRSEAQDKFNAPGSEFSLFIMSTKSDDGTRRAARMEPTEIAHQHVPLPAHRCFLLCFVVHQSRWSRTQFANSRHGDFV